MSLSASHLQDLSTQIRQCESEVPVAVTQATSLLCIAEGRIKVIYADDETSIAGMGILLRVSRQDSHRVQQQSGKMLSVIRASRASGVYFSTPYIDYLGAKWKSLKRSYEDAEGSMVDSLVGEFQAGFQVYLNELAVCAAELDVLVSFALVSHKRKFVRPSMPDELLSPDRYSTLRLEGIFDPFMIDPKSSASGLSCSTDVTIELSVLDGKTFLLVNGDQTSGQANLLKLLGTIVMLNQLGCFVPCEFASKTYVEALHKVSALYSLAFVSLSLLTMRVVVDVSNPAEGLALALSMCIHFMESNTLTCFTSQWCELTEHLAAQSSTTTPMRPHSSSSRTSRSGANFQKPSQVLSEFDKLMRVCDLPADLIARIENENKN
ncbi:unnamed protein product [Phytophthora fragariaefolia]|uniref:Unnamed protein product n=1 Tax=Phytophthora fragariaefolia TaxID=1490495 RepID=A0A9W6YLR0_9STRA|nr:unnamed protein product [Phytophthora fragariaefolia]